MTAMHELATEILRLLYRREHDAQRSLTRCERKGDFSTVIKGEGARVDIRRPEHPAPCPI